MGTNINLVLTLITETGVGAIGSRFPLLKRTFCKNREKEDILRRKTGASSFQTTH
jgi:hypothetical protein